MDMDRGMFRDKDVDVNCLNRHYAKNEFELLRVKKKIKYALIG
jgi:hypothetical protein